MGLRIVFYVTYSPELRRDDWVKPVCPDAEHPRRGVKKASVCLLPLQHWKTLEEVLQGHKDLGTLDGECPNLFPPEHALKFASSQRVNVLSPVRSGWSTSWEPRSQREGGDEPDWPSTRGEEGMQDWGRRSAPCAWFPVLGRLFHWGQKGPPPPALLRVTPVKSCPELLSPRTTQRRWCGAHASAEPGPAAHEGTRCACRPRPPTRVQLPPDGPSGRRILHTFAFLSSHRKSKKAL